MIDLPYGGSFFSDATLLIYMCRNYESEIIP